MERNGDGEWLNADEVAERLGVTADAVHRRMHEGLLPHRHIGGEGEARPHFHADVVEQAESFGGLPYADLEAVEAGQRVARPADLFTWGAGDVWIATRVMRVGKAPIAASMNGDNIGADLPPEKWRVVGPGDPVTLAEIEGWQHAVASGALVPLPSNRGIVADLLDAERRVNELEAELAKARP